MRGTNASNYEEPRDSLARDWIGFMQWALPQALWIPIPNIGQSAVDLAITLQLGGFIFTGGDTIGSYSARDETEHALLGYALDTNLPILGVCRGAQLINSFLGGTLTKAQNSYHCASHHLVHFTKNDLGFIGTQEVNSYHNWVIPSNGLSHELAPLAKAEDETVEAFLHKSAPIGACMWHPERASTLSIKCLLNYLWR